MTTRRLLLQAGALGAGTTALAGVGLAALPPVPRTPSAPLQALSEQEFGIVAAIADRILPSGDGWPAPADLHIAEDVDALLAISPPAALADLKQALRLFDNALSNLIFDGRPVRFTAAPPDVQDAILDAWQNAHLGIRRQVFVALRKLCCGAYFSKPETFAAVGYPGPPDFSAFSALEQP